METWRPALLFGRTWNRRNAKLRLLTATSERTVRELQTAIDLMLALTVEQRRVSVIYGGLTADETKSQIALGKANIGYPEIWLSPQVFNKGAWELSDGMPVYKAGKVTALTYVLAHEWGHTRDFRKESTARSQRRRCPCRQALAHKNSNHWEDYAEAFAEWHLTRGQTDNAAARWYAAENRWRLWV